MSTGGIFPPSISVMLPKCCISGKCRFVIAIQLGSISLAQSARIPHRCAARGKPPIPSNRLPSVKPFTGNRPAFHAAGVMQSSFPVPAYQQRAPAPLRLPLPPNVQGYRLSAALP
nr:MAG TPA: hypothetical protein [Caudoviricetes sp.]